MTPGSYCHSGFRQATLLAALLLAALGRPASAQASTVGEVPPGALRPRSPGTVWLVPADGAGTRIVQPTIQAAVDAAADGDTVRLSDGHFFGPGNRDVLVSGKNVVIRSENGPSRCIVDCQGMGRGFFFEGAAVTCETVLSGITVSNGAGAGILYGGGILAQDSSPTIEGCIVVDCKAQATGGGIAYASLPPTPQGLVRDCLALRNKASCGGGFIVANAVLERCTARGNVAQGGGGGMYLERLVLAKNCLVYDNEAGGGGGVGIEGGLGFVEMRNSTIVDNEAGLGGGIFFASCPDAVVRNCIVWGNVAPDGEQMFQTVCLGFGLASIEYCSVEGGTSQIGGGPGALYQFLHVLDEDPLFLDPTARDYRLSPSSPLIDAGDPDFVADPDEGDHANLPRRNGPVDIGAHERWDGLVLSMVDPGRTGEVNEFRASGADPGTWVSFFSGTQPGRSRIGFGACPSLSLAIEDELFLGTSLADAEGTASHAEHVPTSAVGATFLLQAVRFDPNAPSNACEVSNLVTFTFSK